MKSKWADDPRVMRPSDGRVSRSRVAMFEALEAQGKDGVTTEEFLTLIGAELNGETDQAKKQGLSRMLNIAESDDFVSQYRGRWYLTECLPQNGAKQILDLPAPVSPNGHNSKVAAYMGKRQGRTVSIYTAPRILQNVIGIRLLINNQWFPLMLTGNIRLCIGNEAPNWSPEQEMYSNVEVIKIMFHGGFVEEERPALKDIVTVAAAEEL